MGLLDLLWSTGGGMQMPRPSVLQGLALPRAIASPVFLIEIPTLAWVTRWAHRHEGGTVVVGSAGRGDWGLRALGA